MNLGARELEFLHESNAIENIHEIDYSDPANARPDSGHTGAFELSQQRANAGLPVRIEDLCEWQGLITKEQLRFGHSLPKGGSGAIRSPDLRYNVSVASHLAPEWEVVPGLLEKLVVDMNRALSVPVLRPTDVRIASWLGDFLQRFEAIHPFVDGNGRTGRILANYVATRCQIPIVVVRLADRQSYYDAHDSKRAMRCFMADRIREALFDESGLLLLRVDTIGANDRYQSSDGRRELVVDRTRLLAEQEAWRRLA